MKATYMDSIEAMNVGQKITYIYTCCRPTDKCYGERRIAWCVNPEAEANHRRYTAQDESGRKIYPQTAEGFVLAMIGWKKI